jgi:hypothetical protein
VATSFILMCVFPLLLSHPLLGEAAGKQGMRRILN